MKKHSGSDPKVYQDIRLAEALDRDQDAEFLVKVKAFLKDTPGSLADFSSLIAGTQGNIGFFHYDRAVNSNRVVVEVQFKERNSLNRFLDVLEREDYCSPKDEGDIIQIRTLKSVLEIKVRLINSPGSLASFTALLREHHANVIYMLYNEEIEPEAADIALATRNPEEIGNLLDTINKKAYHYRIVYRGSDQDEVERIIGLKLVEKFFIKVKKLISSQETEKLVAIVDSSDQLGTELAHFYSEVGNHLEKADVFENILTFASASVTKVGKGFRVRELPPLSFSENVELFTFRPPTGGNIFVFRHGREVTLFDSGYGLYYENIKHVLRNKNIHPSDVRQIFVSHNDADHIGTSGYFERAFGTEVFMHPAGKGIIDNDNRAYGANTSLFKLSKHFTILVNRFTKCKYPEKPRFFLRSVIGQIGGFNVIDSFLVGDLKFKVLESHGGHIPGQVFFLCVDYGLFFTADYLINIDSLLPEERDHMRLPRYLMTSTNIDSQIFRKETSSLMDIASLLDRELRRRGKFLRLFPGHGDYYRYNALHASC